MKIGKKENFLVLERDNPKLNHKVRIDSSLGRIIERWKPSTRVSPIFKVEQFGIQDSDVNNLEGNQWLIFLGPVNPWRLREWRDFSPNVWLTLGLFNIIIHGVENKTKKNIIRWLKENKIAYEAWNVENGELLKNEFSIPNEKTNHWRKNLAKLTNMNFPEELRESIKEYCLLVSSALSRCEQALPLQLGDILLSHEIISDIIKELANNHINQSDIYTIRGLLVKINAGLSRFSSQAFSGISPLRETECHYWTHSLLGTGIANFVLNYFYNFIKSRLGEERIVQRVEKLKEKEDNIPDFSIIDNIDFWFKDYLDKLDLTPDDLKEKIFPLFTYFSGRDGFKSTECTLSAPLYVISSCNAHNYTMMILTHEISHLFLRGFLSSLFPGGLEETSNILDIIDGKKVAKNWFESLQKYLALTVVAIEQSEETANDQPSVGNYDAYILLSIMSKWRYEVEEIMVDVFDFLYFYRQDIEKYIRSVWLSWSIIPNIGSRIPEYIMRTLCAILVKNLRRSEMAEEITKKIVLENLETISNNFHPKSYIIDAITYLKKNWESNLKPFLIARKNLVKIVRAFLYSNKIESKLLSEVFVSGGGKSKKEGYKFVPLEIDNKKIGNPLRFVEIYSQDIQPSLAHSFWMLNSLFFNIHDS